MTTHNILGATLAIAATAALSTNADAALVLEETFENYNLGNANGQGLWLDFGGDLLTNIVNTNSNGGSQSIEFATEAVPAAADQYGSDSTLDLAAPITSGQLVLSFDIYQPTGFDGQSNVFLSRGRTNTPDFNFDLGMNLIGEGSTGIFSIEGVAGGTPIQFDQWVSVSVNIDLGADTAVASYGGVEIFNGAWNRAVGTTPTQYQGLNIWANGSGANASAFNIDNLKLDAIPEPSGVALLGLSFIGLALRRRRS